MITAGRCKTNSVCDFGMVARGFTPMADRTMDAPSGVEYSIASANVASPAFYSMITKAPSFAGLRPKSVVTSRAKRSNRSRDTRHEITLRRELRRMGLRFRIHEKALPGRPDIVFPAERVAIFCDGDFWHGRDWHLLKRKLRHGWNATYWLAKISSNMKRDLRNSALLRKLGWRVIRVWEGRIASNPEAMARRVAKTIDFQRHRMEVQPSPIRGKI